jgi:hypothetical protein
LESLEYWKVFAWWFLCCWWRSTDFSEKYFLLVAGTYAVAGDDFLHSILTGDESWLHHSDPETK